MAIMAKRKISISNGVRRFSPMALRREFDRWQAEHGSIGMEDALRLFYQETRRVKDGGVIQAQDMSRYLAGDVGNPQPPAQYSLCRVLDVDWVQHLTEPFSEESLTNGGK